MTGVSKATVYKHLKKLVAEGVVEEKGRAGNIRFYQLNASSPKAKIILMLERFIASEKTAGPIKNNSGEIGGESLSMEACENEGARHSASDECAEYGENEDFVDSYGIEAVSKRNGKTCIIGEFESFEDAEYFLEWDLNQFETLNAKVIRHTEKTSMKAIFLDHLRDFFDYKPHSWESQI